jgi:CO/xanthine dehydrogenase Mo-binding subunit
MEYKIPSRLDIHDLRVEFVQSHEPTGPYGAKSIGEVVCNTPAPAIAQAIYNATGVHFRSLPISAEAVLLGMMKAGDK